MAYLVEDLAARLRKYTDRRGDDECWLWIGPTNGRYGKTKIGGRKGKMWLAHRISWTVNFGAIPPDMCVMHRCDNPPCVNPRHLQLGTVAENMADMVAKERQKNGVIKGSENPNAWLTENDVIEIRSAYANHTSERKLAARFKVSRANIRSILTGKSWRHV